MKYSTEWLITHENSVDWDKLSSDKDENFSLIEIRLFRSKINWSSYLNTHRMMTTSELEVASKYFKESHYRQLAAFDIATDEFVLKNIEKFNIYILLKCTSLSESTILKIIQDKIGDPKIKECIKLSPYINLESKEFSQLALFLESF